MRALVAACLAVTIGGYEYGLDCVAAPDEPAWYAVAPGMLPAVCDWSPRCIPSAWLSRRADIRFRPVRCT